MSKRDRLSFEPSELYTWDREQEQDDDNMSTTSSHIDESRVSKKLKLPNKGNLSTQSLRKAKTPSNTSSSATASGMKRKKTPASEHHINPYLDEPVLNQLSLRDRSIEMHDTHHHEQQGNTGDVLETKQPKVATKSKTSTASKRKKVSTPAPIKSKNNDDGDNDSEDEIINVMSLRDRNVEMHVHHQHSNKGAHPSPFVEDIDLLDEMVLIRNPSTNPWAVGGWKISGMITTLIIIFDSLQLYSYFRFPKHVLSHNLYSYLLTAYRQ